MEVCQKAKLCVATSSDLLMGLGVASYRSWTMLIESYWRHQRRLPLRGIEGIGPLGFEMIMSILARYENNE